MIVGNHERESNETTWQSEFLAMLPEIKSWLRLAFRQLGPEAREDAIEEGVVHSLLSYSRLHGQGRENCANASSLAWYAALAVKQGRPAAGRLNRKDPLSRYSQLATGIVRERRHGEWIDTLVEDKRASVPDQVAAKLDVTAWFSSLTQRMKQIARDLAIGCSTSEVAKKHGLTPGRISQVRRMLAESWKTFQQETAPVVA